MAITLRTVTGSALSHTQLDTNFSSYFYSASVSASVLDLYYTGSSAISLLPRSTSLSLPNSSKWTDVAGGGISRNSEVQITGSANISGSTNVVGTLVQGLAGSQAYNFSHAEGYFTIASASYSHAEGYQAVTSGSYSHAEGRETSTAIGAVGSHAEGYQSIASGSYSHAEGNSSVARGQSAHSEGYGTTAIGPYSHAEGNGTIAQAQSSHAEGRDTVTSGSYSHAEGEGTVAMGNSSHAEGYFTVASGSYQHVQGQYNLSSSAQSAFIIGNGTSNSSRSNLVFASGSTFQITGSLNASGSSHIITGSVNINGAITAASTITTSGFLYASTMQPTTALILSGDGYNGLKLSGSSTNIFVNSSLTVGSGSYVTSNVAEYVRINSGGLAINNGFDLTVHGNKQFNHGMFYHTASITVANGTSGSALLSTTAVANGVSIVDGSKITIANPGYYNIQFTAQLAQGSGTANFYLWFKKNGANIANTTSVNTLPGNSNELMTVDIIDYASNSGDYYEIAHQSNASNSTLEYIAASGNYPAAPPIIVTVQQVR